MRKVLGIIIAAVIAISAGAPVAVAAWDEKSRVEGGAAGYAAINWTENRFTACDDRADAIAVLAQAFTAGGTKYTARDNTSSVMCETRDMTVALYEMRGCKDTWVTNCGPMVYRNR